MRSAAEMEALGEAARSLLKESLRRRRINELCQEILQLYGKAVSKGTARKRSSRLVSLPQRQDGVPIDVNSGPEIAWEYDHEHLFSCSPAPVGHEQAPLDKRSGSLFAALDKVESAIAQVALEAQVNHQEVYTQEDTSVERPRPFLAASLRKQLTRKGPLSSKAVCGALPLLETLHVPFSEHEKQIANRFLAQQDPDFNGAALLLPGRHPNDIRRFWAEAQQQECPDEPDIPIRLTLTPCAHLGREEVNGALVPTITDSTFRFKRPLPPKPRLPPLTVLQTKRMQLARMTTQWETQLGDLIFEVQCGQHDFNKHLCATAVVNETIDGNHVSGSTVLINMNDGTKQVLGNCRAAVSETQWTSDGRHIISGADDGSVCAFSVDCELTWSFNDSKTPIVKLAPHQDYGGRCAVAARDSSKLWLVSVGSRTGWVESEATLSRCVTVSDMEFGGVNTISSKFVLATFEAQRRMTLFQLQPSKLSSLRSCLTSAFGYLVRAAPHTSHLSGNFLVALEKTALATGHSIAVFDPREKRLQNYHLSPHRRDGDLEHLINDMRVSPNGFLLQTSGSDAVVCVHDLRRLGRGPLFEFSCVSTEKERNGEGISTEWTHDSAFLCTGSDDCAVRIWDVRRAPEDALVNTIRRNGQGVICTLTVTRDDSAIVFGSKLGQVNITSVP